MPCRGTEQKSATLTQTHSSEQFRWGSQRPWHWLPRSNLVTRLLSHLKASQQPKICQCPRGSCRSRSSSGVVAKLHLPDSHTRKILCPPRNRSLMWRLWHVAHVIRKVCQPTNAGLHRDQINACRQDFVQRMLTMRGIHMWNKWKDPYNPSVKKLRHPYFFHLPTSETLISHPRVTCHYLQHPPAKARPQSSRPGAARLSSSGEPHALQRRSRDGLLPPPPSLPSSWLGPPALQNSAHGWALTPA